MVRLSGNTATTIIDAKNFFTNLAGTALPEYKRNKFGATLGGPILKDKLHYFGNYEGSRLRQTVQGNAIVPTAQMRSGDLSAYRPLLPGQVLGPTPIIYNPLRLRPGHRLEAAISGQPDPVLSSRSCLLKSFSLHGFTEHRDRRCSPVLGPVELNHRRESVRIRIDWEKSSNTTIYGRYTFSERDAFNGGLVSELQGENTPSSTHSTVIHWNQVLSPTMINDFSVSYWRLKWGIGRPTDVPDVSKEMGWSILRTLPVDPDYRSPI